MEEHIKAKLNGKDAEKVKKLFLTEFKSAQISGLTDKFVNLKDLVIYGVGLKTLKGFPKLPNLTHLDLSGNELADGFEHLSGLEKLTHLVLSGNKLKDIDCLEPLKKLPALRYLVLENHLTKDQSSRSKIYEIIPSLQFLDDKDKELNSAPDSEADELDEGEENGVQDSDDTEDEEDDDDEEYGLAYLQSSKAAQDEDETEDFDPSANGGEEDDDDEDDDIDEEEDEDEGTEEAKSESRGTKRKHEDESSTN